MKFTFLAIVLFAFISAGAQTVHISGAVKDDKGNSIPYAMVQIKKSKVGIYSDSLGNFGIDVPLNSTIVVSHENYKSVELPTAKKEFNVVLTLENSANGTKNNDYTKDADQNNTRTFQNSILNPGSNVYGVRMTGLLPVFTHKEETKGTQYLFNDWVNGAIIDITGTQIILNYNLNYDKMNGILLATKDKTSAIEVDKSQYKSFILYGNSGDTLTYQIVDNIDQTHYAQLLANNSAFKVYKLTITKFVKSDYHTDGMVSSGNRYDEYVDESKYYVCTNNGCNVFSFKKKSITAAFNNDPRVNEYFSKHKDFIDDAYIMGLIKYLDGN